MRGIGRVFRRGNIYWIEYWHRGKQYRESSKSTKESEARKLLKQRLGEMGLRNLLGPIEERVTFDDLAVDYLQDYAFKEQRSSRWAAVFWHGQGAGYSHNEDKRLYAGKARSRRDSCDCSPGSSSPQQNVDLKAGVVRLRPALSKNKNGRVLVLSKPLKDVIDRR